MKCLSYLEDSLRQDLMSHSSPNVLWYSLSCWISDLLIKRSPLFYNHPALESPYWTAYSGLKTMSDYIKYLIMKPNCLLIISLIILIYIYSGWQDSRYSRQRYLWVYVRHAILKTPEKSNWFFELNMRN